MNFQVNLECFFIKKTWKVKMITDVLDHDLIFYCTYNQLCVFIVHGIYNFRLGIGISCTHETWSCSQQRFAGCFIYANSLFDMVCKNFIFFERNISDFCFGTDSSQIKRISYEVAWTLINIHSLRNFSCTSNFIFLVFWYFSNHIKFRSLLEFWIVCF